MRVQDDRTSLFEAVKNPLQFLTIAADGTPGEVRGILDKEPSRRFYVYAKVGNLNVYIQDVCNICECDSINLLQSSGHI